MIKGIVCVDKNWAIGRNNDLLFSIPTDMKVFKQQTMNKIVVCGYNTLLSFPGSKPLKNRSTICICPEEINRDDCYCIHDFDNLVKLIKELAKTQDVYIIGGAMLYQAMLPYYDEVYVTRVEANGDGTVFFPNLDMEFGYGCKDISQEYEDNGYKFRFYTYENRHLEK